MPKIFIKCPEKTFSPEIKNELASKLTTKALHLEKIPDTPYVRSTVWIYLEEYASENVFHSGKGGGTTIVSIEIYAFKGCLDLKAKQRLIEEFTALVGTYAEMPKDRPFPIFIIIKEVEPEDWGIFGKTLTIQNIKNPPLNTPPI